jgi:DNA-directed RNA polymerase specialized sigma24 family protein
MAAAAQIVEPSSFERQGLGEEDRERERRTHRGRTVAMLRRYMRYSIETGRLPSLLGREFFRAKVTSYTVVTFEDRVIFAHDMERCLERLDEFSRQLIARHILQEHDQLATGKLLHCNEPTVRTYVPIVLDLLSEILLEAGLMERLGPTRKNSCQEGERDQRLSSDNEDGEYKV